MVQLPYVKRMERFNSVMVVNETEGEEQPKKKEDEDEMKRWDEVLSDFEKLLVV